eukprot:m.26035 g.26035  ORF g.26035 m.26035 type:complete len:76 (-) comp8783_c0_seq1:1778-2005(-)
MLPQAWIEAHLSNNHRKHVAWRQIRLTKHVSADKLFESIHSRLGLYYELGIAIQQDADCVDGMVLGVELKLCGGT